MLLRVNLDNVSRRVELMMNTTYTYDGYDGYPLNLDSFTDLRIRIALSVLAVLILVFNGTSFVALNRTRHTPKTARFLSSSLLVFDFVAVLLFTVRKLVQDGKYNLLIQMIAIGWTFVAYVNIAIMSLERLLVLQWPIFYLRNQSFSIFRTTSLIIWILCLTFYSVYMITCMSIHYTEVDVRTCFEPMLYLFIMATVPTSSLVSCICLAKILYLIKKHSHGKSTFASYRSTVTVFLCCLNYLIVAFLYCVILVVTVTSNYKRRLFMEVIMTLNALADTCVYVWWYKECRLEVLKICAVVCPSLNNKIENMRLHIFNIVTYSTAQTKRVSV